ncbi:hypothetical protein CCUS01_06397, partial [Colletotrichum cuscutae]
GNRHTVTQHERAIYRYPNPDLADYPCQAGQFQRKHCLQHGITHAPLKCRRNMEASVHVGFVTQESQRRAHIYPPIASRNNQFSLGTSQSMHEICFISSRACTAGASQK